MPGHLGCWEVHVPLGEDSGHLLSGACSLCSALALPVVLTFCMVSGTGSQKQFHDVRLFQERFRLAPRWRVLNLGVLGYLGLGKLLWKISAEIFFPPKTSKRDSVRLETG